MNHNYFTYILTNKIRSVLWCNKWSVYKIRTT